MTENTVESKVRVGNRVGERLRIARKEAQVTIPMIARAVGVNDRTVAGWQSGRSQPSYERLAEIAQLLGKPISYFLDENGNRS